MGINSKIYPLNLILKRYRELATEIFHLLLKNHTLILHLLEVRSCLILISIAGVTAYIIDTGVFVAHPEFEGRARIGKSFSGDGTRDGNGHGTHVAGTIGSKTFGVAKNVSIVAVKVLDNQGSGTTSNVIAGIDWAAKVFSSFIKPTKPTFLFL
jgi:hypothetical protein